MRMTNHWPKIKESLSRGLDKFGSGLRKSTPVNFITGDAKWAIYWMAEYINRGVNQYHPGTTSIIRRPSGIQGRIMHFGTRDQWVLWKDRVSPTNHVVVTCLHGKFSDNPSMGESLTRFIDTLPRVSRVVTSNRIMENRLLEWGVQRKNLLRIPLGVDTSLFRPPTDEQRINARLASSIPDGLKCIGSFQKDGEGWEEGLEPKLIKGPDVFINAVARLNKDIPICVLLTGPARGYVRQGLEKHGIPYFHHYPKDYHDIVGFYHALDLYIVASREEGGPLALPEGMAAGVPVVTTDIGMAPEMIRHGMNGMLAPSEDWETLARYSATVLSDDSLRDEIVKNALNTVKDYAWPVLAKRHYDSVYRPLMDDLGL